MAVHKSARPSVLPDVPDRLPERFYAPVIDPVDPVAGFQAYMADLAAYCAEHEHLTARAARERAVQVSEVIGTSAGAFFKAALSA